MLIYTDYIFSYFSIKSSIVQPKTLARQAGSPFSIRLLTELALYAEHKIGPFLQHQSLHNYITKVIVNQ